MNSDPRAAKIQLRGECGADTAQTLEALAERLVSDGVTQLAIDCSGASCLSGHLLGALQRVALGARERPIAVGVAASGATARAIRSHCGELAVAASTLRLFPTRRTDRPARSFTLASSCAGGWRQAERELCWTPSTLQTELERYR
jgi:anti-anti-sigma regulatory factor